MEWCRAQDAQPWGSGHIPAVLCLSGFTSTALPNSGVTVLGAPVREGVL